MIIHYYQKNYTIQFAVYFLLAVLLWLDVIIFPLQTEPVAILSPVYEGLHTILLKIPWPLQALIAFLLMAFQALILNDSLIRHKIITRNTFLPAMIYMVLMSYTPVVQTIHPVLFANLFLILSFNVILSLYLKPEPYREIFNATFFISLASIFYPPAIIFILLFWLSLLIYRISSIREWIISISGWIAPYLFLLFYYYWTDSLLVFSKGYPGFFQHMDSLVVSIEKPLLPELYLGLGILMAVILITSLIKLAAETSEKVITIRKRMNVIIYSMFIAALSFIWADHQVLMHATLLTIPSCISISYLFSGMKRLALAEIIFTTLILMIVIIKLVYRIEA